MAILQTCVHADGQGDEPFQVVGNLPRQEFVPHLVRETVDERIHQ